MELTEAQEVDETDTVIFDLNFLLSPSFKAMGTILVYGECGEIKKVCTLFLSNKAAFENPLFN